jgi:hypothetical protein
MSAGIESESVFSTRSLAVGVFDHDIQHDIRAHSLLGAGFAHSAISHGCAQFSPKVIGFDYSIYYPLSGKLLIVLPFMLTVFVRLVPSLMNFPPFSVSR